MPTKCQAPGMPGDARVEWGGDEGPGRKSGSLCHLLAVGRRWTFQPVGSPDLLHPSALSSVPWEPTSMGSFALWLLMDPTYERH